MSLVDDAAQNPETPLFELNPFAELDLHLIISIFEEENKNAGTEEGFLLSAYGDIGKQKSRLGSFRDSTNMYGGMYDSGSVDASAGIDPSTGLAFGTVAFDPPPNPFSDCFPCDLRLTSILDSLPMPDFLLWFEDIIEMVEKFIKVIENLMDPTNYYSDLCRLIDMLRIVCPQDLILLMGSLSFLMVIYIRLLIQFDIDWLALVGVIFLPLLLLLHSLLDMMVQLNLNPMTCLADILETMLQLSMAGGDLSAAAAGGLGVEAGFSVSTTGDSNVGLDKSPTSLATPTPTEGTAPATINDSFGKELTEFGYAEAVDDLEDDWDPASELESNQESSSLSLEAPVTSVSVGFGIGTVLEHPILKDFMADDMADAMQEIRAVESLMLSLSSFNIGLPDKFETFKKVLRVLIEMFSGGDAAKLQIISALIQLARMIGLVKAMIGLLQTDGAICTDPEIPLSPSDVQAVLDRLGGYTPGGALPPTTEAALNQSTGTLTVSDTISGNVVQVPTCLGGTTQQTRDQINEWIQQLDAAEL
tara:strand:- start:110 stop:1702 length:1593 start_codon:yes stop_codon:yes gene_type:complete